VWRKSQITKPSSTQSRRLSTENFNSSRKLEPRLFSASYQSEILPHNDSPTATSSALVASRLRIFEELYRLLEVPSRVRALTSDPNTSAPAAGFEERHVGGERFDVFEECPKAKTCTLLLRGGAEQFTEEVERSLHDAIMVVKRAVKNGDVVAGGGVVEVCLTI